MWSGEKLIVEIHARSFHLIIKDEMQTQLQEENMMHYKIHNIDYLVIYVTMRMTSHQVKIGGMEL